MTTGANYNQACLTAAFQTKPLEVINCWYFGWYIGKHKDVKQAMARYSKRDVIAAVPPTNKNDTLAVSFLFVEL
jgi:hypothetical protein